MLSFIGVTITVVDSGTEIGKDEDGSPVIVTDTKAVFKGGRAWVTQKVYEKIKGGAA